MTLTAAEQASTEVKVPAQDLWVMLMSTIRYAMGRRSYMPSLSIEFVERYRSYLTDQQFKQLLDEVRSEIARYEAFNSRLGDVIDHETWKNFVEKYKDIK